MSPDKFVLVQTCGQPDGASRSVEGSGAVVGNPLCEPDELGDEDAPTQGGLPWLSTLACFASREAGSTEGGVSAFPVRVVTIAAIDNITPETDGRLAVVGVFPEWRHDVPPSVIEACIELGHGPAWNGAHSVDQSLE